MSPSASVRRGERARLREVVEALKPPSGRRHRAHGGGGPDQEGARRRTSATCIGVWEDVWRKLESAKAPSVLYTELDLVLKTARDLFTDEIETS